MKYSALMLIVLLILIFIEPSSVSNEPQIVKVKEISQPEIFSDKPKPNCIANIQVQQKSMVKELKKIKSILKKRKQQAKN